MSTDCSASDYSDFESSDYEEFAQDSNNRELTIDETVTLCNIIDNDKYDDSVNPELVNNILNMVSDGYAVLDTSDLRYEDDKAISETNNLSKDELCAIIAIQEGDIPDCSDDVLNSALEKVSTSETDIDADDESSDNEQTELPYNEQTWTEWAFGKSDKEQSSRCVMM